MSLAKKIPLLSGLKHNGKMTAGEIADVTGHGRQSVGSTLSNLVERGVVVKAGHNGKCILYSLPGMSSVRRLLSLPWNKSFYDLQGADSAG